MYWQKHALKVQCVESSNDADPAEPERIYESFFNYCAVHWK